MSTQEKPKLLKIFVYAVDGIGHLNACVGVAQALAQRGHSITFLVNEGFKGQFEKYGFIEILLKKSAPPTKDGEAPAKPENPVKEMANMLIKMNILGPKSPLEKMREHLETDPEMFKELHKSMPELNVQIEKAIEEGQPDVFIVDSFVIPTAVLKASCPWIFLCSAQPLTVFPSKGKLPPYGNG